MYNFYSYGYDTLKGRRIPLNIDAKEIWLCYFNQVLFDKGIITEKEKSKMNNLIYKQCHSQKKTDKIPQGI